MIFEPATTGAGGETVRVTDAPGERGQWYLWNDDGDVGDVSGVCDRLQLSDEYIKTNTLVKLEDER